MAQLPQTVRLTLKRMVPPGVHPEPGQLAAFAEQALPRHQRASMLNHLASCGECREWLRLTITEPAEAAQRVPRPPAPGASGRRCDARACTLGRGCRDCGGILSLRSDGPTQDSTTPLPAPSQFSVPSLRPPKGQAPSTVRIPPITQVRNPGSRRFVISGSGLFWTRRR